MLISEAGCRISWCLLRWGSGSCLGAATPRPSTPIRTVREMPRPFIPAPVVPAVALVALAEPLGYQGAAERCTRRHSEAPGPVVLAEPLGYQGAWEGCTRRHSEAPGPVVLAEPPGYQGAAEGCTRHSEAPWPVALAGPLAYGGAAVPSTERGDSPERGDSETLDGQMPAAQAIRGGMRLGAIPGRPRTHRFPRQDRRMTCPT
jgi:hypothetical protein